MTLKNLLITFDYELFLGEKSGSVNRCIIEPTTLILSILSKYNIKAIFFVDTTYLIRLKEISKLYQSAFDDFTNLTKQLQALVLTGHYIFPHLHPHWLDAVYNPSLNQWNLSDLSKYRFRACSEIERALMFNESIGLLKQIITPVNPNYSIDSYRAGGWCIQPFSDFKPFFERYGIHKEFSVLRGKSEQSNSRWFDFLKAPLKNVYLFQEDILKEDIKGKFIEYTISVIQIPKFFNFLKKKLLLRYLWHIKRDKSFGDGRGAIAIPINAQGQVLSNNKITEMVSIENLYLTHLHLYNRHLEQHDYMHFLSHPKMLTQHNVYVFEKFLSRSFGKFEIETDYLKIPVGI